MCEKRPFSQKKLETVKTAKTENRKPVKTMETWKPVSPRGIPVS